VTALRTEAPAAPTPPKPPDMTVEERRFALLRIAAVVMLGLGLAAWRGALPTVLILVSLIVMIMLHELGHFMTAKWGGMKVTEYFVGFGPRLWSVRKGETEYGIKALPLGGYVKIIGMHNLDHVDDPADEPRAYRQRPFPQRLAVAVAGSTMHVLIAFVLFIAINTAIGIPAPSMRIGEISTLPGGRSPAVDAGFKLGDRVVAVDGHRFASWDQIPPYIKSHPEQAIHFTVQRRDATLDLVARPIDTSQVHVDGLPAATKPTGFIGIASKAQFVKRNPITGVGLATTQLIGGDFGKDPQQVAPGLIDTGRALAGVLSPSGLASYWKTLTGQAQPNRPDGGTRFLSPVGVAHVAGQAAATGMFEVLLLLIAINLFVGLFNLLPLLPLDGGHVAIAVYEAVRSRFQGGRRYFADVAKLLPVTYVVVMLMVFLGVSALYLDIVRPLNLR
jgi:membrane-associated protease RseP (regulator of RpoE activity)